MDGDTRAPDLSYDIYIYMKDVMFMFFYGCKVGVKNIWKKWFVIVYIDSL